jgi:hypothetical protein
VTIREQLSVSLLRDGGLNSFELKGDLDLRVNDAAQGKIRLALAPSTHADLQFKQHPNVAKFGAAGEKVIALKDPSRSFPVGQGLGVLRWRMTAKDESAVPLTGEWGAGLVCVKSVGIWWIDVTADTQSRSGRSPGETGRRMWRSSTSSRRRT